MEFELYLYLALVLCAINVVQASQSTKTTHPLLTIPPDLNITALPLWHSDGGNAEFVMLRTDFQVVFASIIPIVPLRVHSQQPDISQTSITTFDSLHRKKFWLQLRL